MGVSTKKLTPATQASALSAESRKQRKCSRNNVPRKAHSSKKGQKCAILGVRVWLKNLFEVYSGR